VACVCQVWWSNEAQVPFRVLVGSEVAAGACFNWLRRMPVSAPMQVCTRRPQGSSVVAWGTASLPTSLFNKVCWIPWLGQGVQRHWG
jgi:hypothetical protein